MLHEEPNFFYYSSLGGNKYSFAHAIGRKCEHRIAVLLRLSWWLNFSKLFVRKSLAEIRYKDPTKRCNYLCPAITRGQGPSNLMESKMKVSTKQHYAESKVQQKLVDILHAQLHSLKCFSTKHKITSQIPKG